MSWVSDPLFGFVVGMSFGSHVNVTTPLLTKCLSLSQGAPSGTRKTALFALHAFLALSAIGAYFVIPQMGLSFFAIRILQ